MIKKLYAGGKAKAFYITYDDGVLQDVRFVELMDDDKSIGDCTTMPHHPERKKHHGSIMGRM